MREILRLRLEMPCIEGQHPGQDPAGKGLRLTFLRYPVVILVPLGSFPHFLSVFEGYASVMFRGLSTCTDLDLSRLTFTRLLFVQKHRLSSALACLPFKNVSHPMDRLDITRFF